MELPVPAPETDDTVSFAPGTLLVDEDSDILSKVRRPRQKTDTVHIPNAGRMINDALTKHNDVAEDRKARYRHWLEGRSREELVELLMDHEGEPPSFETTQKLRRGRVDEAQNPSPHAFAVPDGLTYIRLPVVRTTEVNEPTPTWQIALVSLDTGHKPLGLIIDSEITIGRAGGEDAPDLDLMPYGASTNGVSRIHARIRPAWNSLWLIDNDSSNGTFWNRLRIPNEVEQPLKEGDVIAFGRITFLVKIVKSPSMGETRTVI